MDVPWCSCEGQRVSSFLLFGFQGLKSGLQAGKQTPLSDESSCGSGKTIKN